MNRKWRSYLLRYIQLWQREKIFNTPIYSHLFFCVCGKKEIWSSVFIVWLFPIPLVDSTLSSLRLLSCLLHMGLTSFPDTVETPSPPTEWVSVSTRNNRWTYDLGVTVHDCRFRRMNQFSPFLHPEAFRSGSCLNIRPWWDRDVVVFSSLGDSTLRIYR